ncbi:MAG: peptidoglycan-associated lipoprotein Pal [Alphaproteobacteria bacterium]|tara:strand:+ start:283 stop:768 length:486 start_codon:yes stop_codon:yes gene_type:complete
MKNKYLSLLFASFLIVSGCETIGGSSSSSDSPSYAYGDSKQANLQGYLQNEIGDRVYFETNKHNINSAAAFILESQANWLNSTPGFQIIIEGHCDERGTREYNLALGERRANSVKEFLVSLGVDSGRITTISYGKERPAADGSTSESWAENRRSVTVVGSE